MKMGETQTMNAASAGTFNYKVVRQFTIMTVVWGIVGMLVGVIIAAQLLWPELNFDVPWLSYGRLRPLHAVVRRREQRAAAEGEDDGVGVQRPQPAIGQPRYVEIELGPEQLRGDDHAHQHAHDAP